METVILRYHPHPARSPMYMMVKLNAPSMCKYYPYQVSGNIIKLIKFANKILNYYFIVLFGKSAKVLQYICSNLDTTCFQNVIVKY